MKGTFAFFIFYLINPSFTFSQEIFYLWDKVPGSKDAPNYKEQVDSARTWITKVSKPRLDYYPVIGQNKTNTAVIICPGGGYAGMAAGHEGKLIAAWLNGLGVTAFVLKYRLPSDEIMLNKTIGPLQDAQEAMRVVRRNAKTWNIDPNKIGIMGFSAGGHLASTLSTHYTDQVYKNNDTISARPDFSLLIYPVISMDSAITHMGSRNNLLGKNQPKTLVQKYSNELQINKNSPPAFLVHSIDDNVVPVENSIRYALNLKKNKVSAELHIFEKGGHGYGMGSSLNTESQWTTACQNWLRMHGLINKD